MLPSVTEIYVASIYGTNDIIKPLVKCSGSFFGALSFSATDRAEHEKQNYKPKQTLFVKGLFLLFFAHVVPPVPESGTIFYIFPQVSGKLTIFLLFSTASCQKRCYGKHTRRCSGGVSSPAQAPSSVAGAAGPLYNGISGRSKIRVKRGT